MASNTLIIKELTRTPRYDSGDKLEFTSGVNLIVGTGNTGKTKWLSMLDYLMGDRGKPEKAFLEELTEKYDSVGAIFSINGEEFHVERRWKEKGVQGKVFVEGDKIDATEFQDFLLERLKIPVIHFPKGNPYEERTWPELSWRYLLRHIYRQQRFWSDIADKTTETEQHACLMQFLGIAEHLFSNKSGELVQKRKELWKLEGAKEQFLSILDQISRDVTDEKEIQIAVTGDSVNQAIHRLNTEIQTLQSQREQILLDLQNRAQSEVISSIPNIDQLGQEWAQLLEKKDVNLVQFNKIETRLIELQKYKSSLENEISKMERALKAGQIFSDIKITHCPVCDQPVKQNDDDITHCYLCGQDREENNFEGSARVQLEIYRLQDEKLEALELIKTLSEDRDKTIKEGRNIREGVHRIESQLTPVRQVTSSILSPEIGVIDMEKGRLQERVRQLERIKSALNYQKSLSEKIDQLTNQISELQSAVDIETKKITFAYSGDLLSEGMNSYFNALLDSGKKLWQHNRVNLNLKDRGFNFTIDGNDWSTKLGGTARLYFLLSYHYGLLSLTNKAGCHYPGLVILDLPATFIDGSIIQDKENFIAQPFIDLTNKPEMKATQVIITGSAFEGLDNLNRITLTRVWQ